ncbi:5-(carboxyamino)imidazole ribonucleotide synthase [Acinetobacter baumannii]|uniref:5-(carboxyamino)imidazole ribonucleotide synthase n=1 Tax=Acinetobacter baumannii TaxID=470 RepID=UPI00069973A5|nr:5-(carboxyamino)imidazole ribonucleotide synthase [Acinetobacter baumannii]KHW36748.2 phosphoribosylaminoimidazole carboxylase [Acinetobacter baumannii]MDC4581152.1 5-(carboxyamino)imidazole ribonucleotide synthase [Acinetobacter baumannii]MDC4588371.1 5-(carboxyamino)imidazole ribonucleotide synthase [Acinetobacter baumannii]MDC4663770.1 5-(carboxyamino)imidazole ribonucleotide synthase [Acinetobacter baumannii]MDC4678277.1 5-(carboxyamino)imidazole ribonucleotide synthase [Acinetobacter b
MDKTIGIFGGGQLGRMMAQAALPLNIQCTFFEANTDCPAGVLGQVFSSQDEQGLKQFIESADVFSLEFENTPVADVDVLTQTKTLHPPRIALATAQNRLSEKALFDELEIPVAPYRAVDSLESLKKAVAELGLPIVLKTATGGYDGKGQFVLRSEDQIDTAWAELGPAKSLVAESFVKFSREVSIIAVRGQNGEVKTWPLAENHHHNGILSHSIVPAPNSEALQPVAQDYITRLLNHLNYVGVLTLELFVTEQGLCANEMAPRVHNSGHWSIEGAVCSQFENHIRAVAGLPLGSTDVVRPTVMINIIGQHPKTKDVLALNGAHLHLYNKSERAGRKLGHITLMPVDSNELTNLCRQLAKILPEPLALTDDMII